MALVDLMALLNPDLNYLDHDLEGLENDNSIF